jgi:valyl-tRNA synthetase
LSSVLILLAPITPFITDYLWQNLYSKKTIHREKFVEPEGYEDWTRYTKDITEFNSEVWNKKKSMNLSLKDTIEIVIPQSLEMFVKDLRAMHNIK